jgi:hypothetical protein
LFTSLFQAGRCSRHPRERDADDEACCRTTRPQHGGDDFVGAAEPADWLVATASGTLSSPLAIMSVTMGVSTGPGQTALMRIPCGALLQSNARGETYHPVLGGVIRGATGLSVSESWTD